MAQRFMSRPPSTPPPADPPEPPESIITSIEPSDESAMTIPTEWDLSNAQFKELLAAMRRMIWEVGCPEHLHLDVVQDAFVVALSKPISERVPVTEWRRFVAWMCTVAKYSTLTNRNTEQRRRESDEVSEEEMAELLAVAAPDKDFLALDALEKACLQLEPEAQALIRAHYFEGKSIKELVDEKGLPWSTMKSRVDRVLELLRYALQSIIVAIILLVTKNVRAQGARLARHVSHLLPHATQAVGAMAVTVTCGVLVPSASNAMGVSQGSTAVVLSTPPRAAVTTAMMPAAPPVAPEVEPEKLITIDELNKQWSADEMKATTIVRYLQATMLPFAFLVTPAVSQVACAGTEHNTPPPQEPQEPDDGDDRAFDPYDMMCANERRRGNDCESKADWCASMGKRPAPKGCQ